MSPGVWLHTSTRKLHNHLKDCLEYSALGHNADKAQGKAESFNIITATDLVL